MAFLLLQWFQDRTTGRKIRSWAWHYVSGCLSLSFCMSRKTYAASSRFCAWGQTPQCEATVGNAQNQIYGKEIKELPYFTHLWLYEPTNAFDGLWYCQMASVAPSQSMLGDTACPHSDFIENVSLEHSGLFLTCVIQLNVVPPPCPHSEFHYRQA